MKDWIEKLNGFLSLNNREILNNAGNISHQLVKENTEKEYKELQNKIENKKKK